MDLTDETETFMPSPIKLTHSVSESDADIDTTTNTITTINLTSPPNTKPYYSENDDEWEYKKDHIKDIITSTNKNRIRIHKKRKHIQRSNSDLATSLHSAHSKYAKKNKKMSAKLENLNLDDLKNEYLRQRKQRKKDKKQYKEMTRQFHETITKTADEYEDALSENQTQLKQEYEAKLIEAEIKRNSDEQKITALNAEVSKLKTLLAMQLQTHNMNHSTNQSLHSLDAEIGPINKIMSPIAPQMMIHNHAFSFSGTIQNHNNIHNIDEGIINNSNQSNNSNKTPNSNNEINTNNISLVMPMPNVQSMEQKLKMAMSPSLKYNHQYANIGTPIHHDCMQQNEGTDDDDNMVIFDGYNEYKGNDNNNNMDSDESVSDTPEIVRKKRRKKKKKKRKNEETSFWDFLLKCVTPSVCEDNSV